MKKVFRFGLVLISLLTLFSCNPFSVDDDDDYAISAGQESSPVTTELQNNAETGSQNLQPQKAFIKVVFNDGSSRTVLPSLYLKNFVLTGKRNGGTVQELAKAATKSDWSGKSIEILTGNWEFTMSAEVADGSTVVDGVTVFKDTQAVSVGSGANVLSFVLKPFKSDGTEVSGGELSVTLSLDPEAKADKARAVLKSLDGTTIAATDYPDSGKLSQGASITFQKSNLPAGTYDLEIEFYSENENGDKIKQNSWMAIVRIAAGLKSSATVQNFNLNEVYKITYETNGGTLATGVHILSYSRKSEAIELASCSKTGFLFMGWYETNNPALADVPAAAKTNFSPQTEARNKTFFALWTKNTVYVKAGGSGNGFSSESPVGNFTDAITAIGKIKTKRNSAQDFTIKVCGEVNGNQEIPSDLTTEIATTLTIEGETGNTMDSLSANGSGTTLTVGSAVPVTIKNLKITGGNGTMINYGSGSHTRGGGIYMDSGTSVTLESGTLISDNHVSGYGGGVYSLGSLTLKNGSCVGDGTKTAYATNSGNSNSAKCGGGIYCAQGSVTIETDAKVSYNYATADGGGLCYSGPTSPTTSDVVTLSGGEIAYNYSGSNGGGIFLKSGSFVFSSGKIHNNYSLGGVGGLYLENCNNAVMSGGSIYDNSTYEIQKTSEIYMESAILSMSGGTVSNTTLQTKGVIVGLNSGLEMSGSAEIASNTPVYFSSNTKIKVSGALTGTAPVATIKFSNWTRGITVVEADGTNVSDLTPYKDYFVCSNSDWKVKLSSDNKKLMLDSPIYVSKIGMADAPGTRSNPRNTIAKACELMTDKDTDYTIFISGEVTGGQEIPSTLKANGTGTYNAKSVTISGATGNTTDSLNGGFNKDSNGTTLKILSDVPVTIKNLKITGGYAAQASAGGGGIYNKGDITLSQGALVSGNYTLSFGGGIYNDSKTLTIESGAEISGNGETSPVSEVGGGAIFNYGGTVMISGGVIKSNSADHDGGAIYNEDGTCYIYGDTLIGKVVSSAPDGYQQASNYAANGGAICVNGGTVYLGYKNNNGTAQKDDSANVRIMGNAGKSAIAKGGAVYVEAGALQVAKTFIAFNYSPYIGAGIYTRGAVKLLEDAVVKGNKAFPNNASSYGGGVFVDESGKLNMTSNSIIGGSESGDANTAAYGGGVYVSSSSSAAGKEAIVTFGVTGAEVSPSISGNSATSSGGGIYITGSGATVNMHSGTISNNKVTTGTTGGGIYVIQGGTLNMEGGTISGNYIDNNSTSKKGGAINVNTNGKFNIKGTVSIPYGGETGKNDVCMQTSDPIKITGAITLPEGVSSVATIIPYSYTESVITLDPSPSPTTTLENEAGKFSIEEEGYLVGTDGMIYSSHITSLTSYPLPAVFSKIPAGSQTPVTITLSGNANITPGDFTVTYPLIIEGNYELSSVYTIFTVKDGGKLTVKEGVTLIASGSEKNAILQDGGEVIIEGTENKPVSLSNTTNAGAAIAISGGNFTASYINLSADGNYSQPLEIKGGTVVIDNMTITGQTHATNGSGVYIYDGIITFTACSITNNTSSKSAGSSRKGGGIYMNNGNLTLNSCSITGNKVEYYVSNDSTNAQGGGIYVERGTITIDSLTSISGNQEVNNNPNIDGKQIYLNSGVVYNGTTLSSVYTVD